MIPCGDIHHLRLTVTDVQRSREFYTGLLGFQVVVESPPPGDPAADEVFKLLFGGVVMARGNLIMGLRPMAPAADRFHPDRAGLDHLSFGVPARGDLEQAVRLFDERGVTHGEIPGGRRSASTCSRSRTRTESSSSSPRGFPRTAERPGSLRRETACTFGR